MTPKLAAVGVAFPRLVLANDDLKAAWGAAPRDVTERRIPSFDEDATTLAVEAARRAMGGRPAGDLRALVFVGREPAAATVAEALGIRSAHLADAHGTRLAALLPRELPALVVAADVPSATPGDPREAVEGAGAVALLLDREGADVDAAADPPVSPLRARTGDLGVAQRLLDLVSHLADRKAVQVDAEHALGAGKRVTYARALQERRIIADPLPDQPMGAFVPLGTFEASIPARWRLEGARCAACARTFLPAPARCHECGGPVEPHAFPWRGKVYASTVIGRGGAPSEFAEQQRQTGEYGVVVVELEGGARTVAQVADADARPIALGTEVEPVFRRLYAQQGVVRYGLKWRSR